MFPAFLLAKLFVKGSLKNSAAGFEFKIKNIIDTATIVEVGPIGVDGQMFPAEAWTVVSEGKRTPAREIDTAHPLLARAFREVTLELAGDPLAAGSHAIEVNVLTREVGKISFQINEEIRAQE